MSRAGNIFAASATWSIAAFESASRCSLFLCNVHAMCTRTSARSCSSIERSFIDRSDRSLRMIASAFRWASIDLRAILINGGRVNGLPRGAFGGKKKI